MGDGLDSYDDPYWMLAWYIVSHHSRADIVQALTSKEWLLRQLRQECYLQDFRGPFLDTIMEQVDNHHRLWLRQHLNQLADAFFSMLDVTKLRDYISQICGLSV